MSESNSGFSFGVSPEQDGDEIADVDAVEVSGDPVTRSEAKNLGYVQFDTNREAKTSSARFRLDQLPSDISVDQSKKLEIAWQHLKRNEIAEALTLAQEVVWEYPSLVAAKVIIARCFINRKEYPKALNILQAIPTDDLTAETQYYIALCLSRSGKIKEALDALKLAKGMITDQVTRKRINDLQLQLQGEQVVCPSCGKKVLYDSMVEVGDQTVCANCAKNMPEDEDEDEYDEDDDDWDDDDESSGGRRRKRLRPPLTRMDILIRVVLALLLIALLGFGLWAMSFVAPVQYSAIRSYLPASWTFLPNAGNVSTPAQIREEAAQQARPQPAITFDSPPISHAVAGVELRHRAFIEGMEKRGGTYRVTFTPQPAGPFEFNEKTGELVWTPARQDAEKSFDIGFSANINNVRAKDQINTVVVGAGPRFRNVHSLGEPKPGQIAHILSVDLNEDGEQEIVAVHGQYWEGQISVIEETPEGFFQPLSRTAIPGRPAGAGVVMAENETWVAVADYWNSRLRHYALRDGNLSEMAVDVDLPGRPLLAGFDRDSSTSAILCRTEDRLMLVCYRQQGQLKIDKIGQWPVSDEIIWRTIVMLPGNTEKEIPPTPVLVGSDPDGGVVMVDLANNALVPQELEMDGEIVNAIGGRNGNLYCLTETEGALNLVSFRLSPDGAAQNTLVSSAGPAPALGGMTNVGFYSRNGDQDLVLFSSGRIGVAFSRNGGRTNDVSWWDLPSPFRLRGPAISVPSSANHPARVFYIDEIGDMWRASMAEPEARK